MPKDIFKFNRFSYTPEGAKQLTEKNLREEYSRLRSIAVKRLHKTCMKRAHNRADYDLNVKYPDRRRKLRSGLIMR